MENKQKKTKIQHCRKQRKGILSSKHCGPHYKCPPWNLKCFFSVRVCVYVCVGGVCMRVCARACAVHMRACAHVLTPEARQLDGAGPIHECAHPGHNVCRRAPCIRAHVHTILPDACARAQSRGACACGWGYQESRVFGKEGRHFASVSQKGTLKDCFRCAYW